MEYYYHEESFRAEAVSEGAFNSLAIASVTSLAPKEGPQNPGLSLFKNQHLGRIKAYLKKAAAFHLDEVRQYASPAAYPAKTKDFTLNPERSTAEIRLSVSWTKAVIKSVSTSRFVRINPEDSKPCSVYQLYIPG